MTAATHVQGDCCAAAAGGAATRRRAGERVALLHHGLNILNAVYGRRRVSCPGAQHPSALPPPKILVGAVDSARGAASLGEIARKTSANDLH